jgi:ribosome-binding protein aMBF1 (putative translation factor)
MRIRKYTIDADDKREMRRLHRDLVFDWKKIARQLAGKRELCRRYRSRRLRAAHLSRAHEPFYAVYEAMTGTLYANQAVDRNADRDEAKKVYESLARLRIGEGWIWAPDHDLLKQVTFPEISPLDTSKTPTTGDTRITAPVMASADLAKIARKIQTIQATQDGKGKRSGKSATAKPALVPVKPKPVRASAPKKVTATASSQPGAAILAARRAASLSQIELAAKLKTAQANIARLENGGSIPSTTTLQRIAKATGHKLVITFSRNA